MSLDADDIAYMRSVQDEHRPTTATLFTATVTRTAAGGQTTGYVGPGLPVQVRISAGNGTVNSGDRIPREIADRLGGADGVKIVLHAGLDVRSGDRLEVSPSEAYVFVSDGVPDKWSTAQVTWGKRTTHPARADA